MGKPPVFESDDPGFVDAVARVLKSARNHGLAAGIHVLDVPAAQRRIKEGFQFIAVASEAGMMLSKAQETAQALGLGAHKTIARY
jgi:2-keto-3-deoxy-L-rhamnonate aldolase RhmA